MTNGVVGKITAGGGTHLIASTAYAECDTSASTPTKVVTIKDSDGNAADFTLHKGVTIHVRMKYGSTPVGELLGVPIKLNVNGTGAKEVIRDTGNAAQDKTEIADNYNHNGWQAGHILQFTYDGTYWVISGEPRPTGALGTIQDGLDAVRGSLNSFKNTVNHTYLGYSDSDGAHTYGKLIRKEISVPFNIYLLNPGASASDQTYSGSNHIFNPGIGNFYPISFVPIEWGYFNGQSSFSYPENPPCDVIMHRVRNKDSMSTVSFDLAFSMNYSFAANSSLTVKGYLYGLQVGATA